MMASIHDAVRNGQLDIVKDQIASGVDVNSRDSSKRTPLHLAVWTGNIEIVKLLVRAKADLLAKAMDAFTPLHFAAQKDTPAEIIKILVHKERSLLNSRISKGNKTALHIAASKNLFSVIQTLVELGADINAKTNQGKTAFDLATDQKVCKYLLEQSHEQKNKKHVTNNTNIDDDNNNDDDIINHNIDNDEIHENDINKSITSSISSESILTEVHKNDIDTELTTNEQEHISKKPRINDV